MKRWIEHNFPNTRYDAVEVIFSPLVAGNQSSNHFENDEFSELHAHVNYPYMNEGYRQRSSEVATLTRRSIVFTELNHGYINAESEEEEDTRQIDQAFQNIDDWVDREKPAGGYASAYACFNEYMNWGLVSLRYIDAAQKDQWPALLRGVEDVMSNRRGFRRFDKFNQFLVALYQERAPGQVITDLYPQIIQWFLKK